MRSALFTTALATGVLMGASLWSAHEGVAGCVDVEFDPNVVFCDDEQTTTDDTYDINSAADEDDDRDERHYRFNAGGNVDVEIEPDGDIDGFGLAVTTTEAGATITVDHQGAISVDAGNNPTEGGTAVFNLTTAGGSISYTGDGSITDNDGGNNGLVIEVGPGAGLGIIQVDGAGNITAGTDGIVANQTNNAPGTFGHLTIAGTGNTEGTAGTGIHAEITGANNAGHITVMRSGDVVAGTIGINAETAGSGIVNVSGVGNVTGGNNAGDFGIRAASGGGNVIVTPGAQVSGATGIGASTGGSGQVIVTVANDVTGTNGDGIQTSAVDGLNFVRLLGGTISATEDGVNATSTGTGGILVDMAGGEIGTAGSPVGGNGILAESSAGATGGDIDVNATSIFAQARGVLARILGVANDGNVTVDVADGGVVEGGVTAETAGTGNAQVTIGDNATVTGNSPGSASITAGGNAIQIIGNNVVVTGSSGVVVDQTNPAGAGMAVVLVGDNSTIVGDGTDATDPYNGNGIFARNRGTGLIAVVTGSDTSVTGATNGIRARAAGGSVTITTNGPVVGNGGDGIRAVSPGGTVVVTANDAVRGSDDAIDARGATVVVTSNVAARGGDAGIEVRGGDITVNARGTTTGTTGDGIRARSTAGNVAVTASGLVRGGDDGMDLRTGGAGDVTVVSDARIRGGDHGIVVRTETGDITIASSGRVTGDADGDGSGDGINAASAAGGDVVVTTSGVIRGARGIVLSTTGGGSIDLQTGRRVVGSAGHGIRTSAATGPTQIATGDVVTGTRDGIHARSTGGAITINTFQTVRGDRHGIAASAGGGAVTITTNGRVFGNGGDGIRAVSPGGTVVVTANDAVRGSDDAIDARGATVVVTSNVAARGGDAGIEVRGGDITVNARGTTTGTTGDGIRARSTAGNVAVMASGLVRGGDDGMDLRTGGAGDVTVVSDARIRGNAHGVVVRTETGDIAITSSGRVTGDADGDGSGDGINAASTAGGDIDVTTSGVVRGARGIVLSTTGGGSIDLLAGRRVVGSAGHGIRTSAATGPTQITTDDVVTGTGDGIHARSTGGAITINTIQTVRGDRHGIAASAGGGPVTITTGGKVFGNGGDGIRARGGTIAITTADSVVGASDGILTRAAAGATVITANANVTGGLDGIDARATGGGAITITNNAPVVGTAGDGIRTRAVNGNTRINAEADVTGGRDGIDARATGTGDVDVNVAGGVTVTGNARSGVDIRTTDGTGTLRNSGLIEGALAAVSGATDTLIRIFNTAAGTIQNLSGAVNHRAIRTDGSTRIENDGLIVGRINTGAGDDVFNNRGTWATRGTSDFGAGDDIIRNAGRIVVGHDPALSETTRFANLERFVNRPTGVIDMVDDNAPGRRDVLTIDGKYTGVSGSRVEMDLALTIGRNPHTDSDLLILDAADPAEGRTDLLFNIVSTGVTATTENTGRAVFLGGQLLDIPVTVVENRGDLRTSSGEDNIPLARSGFVNYDLVSTAPSGGDYQVVSQLDEGLAGGILLPISATLAAVAFTTQRSPTPITAQCVDPAVKPHAQAGWARVLGGEARTDARGEAVGGGATGRLESRNRTRFRTLQGGLDGVLCDFDGHGGNLHLGVTVGQTWGESRQTNIDRARDISGTDVDFDSFFIGPYAAYTRGSLAVQASLRFDHHSLELSNLTPGIEVRRLDIDASSVSGSAAVSYEVAIGQFMLTPEIGVNVSNTEVDDFTIAGADIELDDLLSVIGHFGITGRTTITLGDNLFGSPFASATIYNEFIDDAKSRFTLGRTVEVESNRVGTFGQIGAGMNVIRLGDVAAGEPTIFGGARADLQFGDRIQGFTATVFGRVQF